MLESKRKNERLSVLLLAGLLALNYPILELFSKKKLLFGIPVLYIYLYVVWLVFIGCVALLVNRTTSFHQTFKSPPEK